jgi:hypothetical protein
VKIFDDKKDDNFFRYPENFLEEVEFDEDIMMPT